MFQGESAIPPAPGPGAAPAAGSWGNRKHREPPPSHALAAQPEAPQPRSHPGGSAELPQRFPEGILGVQVVASSRCHPYAPHPRPINGLITMRWSASAGTTSRIASTACGTPCPRSKERR